MDSDKIDDILTKIKADFDVQIALRRSVTLDIFEAMLDSSPHWPMLRKKLLSLFGESGLEGDLNTILLRVKRDNLTSVGSQQEFGDQK